LAQPWYALPPIAYQIGSASDGAAQVAESAPSPLNVAYPITFYSDATDAESATPIAIRAGERATADIVLHAVPALRLRVRRPIPPAAADSQARTRPFVAVRLRKKAFGNYIDIPTAMIAGVPGSTDVTAIAPGKYELIVIVNGPEGRSEMRQDLDLQGNTELDDNQNAVALASVSGVLRLDGSARENIPATLISFRDAESGQAWSTRVNPDGQFELSQPLPPGKYEIALSAQNMYIRSVRASGARVRGREIEIASEPVKLTLIGGQGLTSVDGVALRDGKPQPGAMIILVPENPEGKDALFRRDQSDSDGTFTLRSAVPGKYVVIAVRNWDFAWQDPETLRRLMPGGQPVDVQPGGKYQISVQVQ
jgi:hypothetical protein